MNKWEEIKCKTERTEEGFIKEVEGNKNNSRLAKKYYNEVKKQKGKGGNDMSKKSFIYEVNRTVRRINENTGRVEHIAIKDNADIIIEREFFTGNYRAFISFPNYVGGFNSRDNLSGFANFLGLTVQRETVSDKITNIIFVLTINGGKYATLNDIMIIPKTKEEKKYLESKKVMGLAEMEEIAKITTNRILEFVNVTSDYINAKMQSEQ
jgi:hypothetical protein